jgi:hypothetical protein
MSQQETADDQLRRENVQLRRMLEDLQLHRSPEPSGQHDEATTVTTTPETVDAQLISQDQQHSSKRNRLQTQQTNGSRRRHTTGVVSLQPNVSSSTWEASDDNARRPAARSSTRRHLSYHGSPLSAEATPLPTPRNIDEAARARNDDLDMMLPPQMTENATDEATYSTAGSFIATKVSIAFNSALLQHRHCRGCKMPPCCDEQYQIGAITPDEVQHYDEGELTKLMTGLLSRVLVVDDVRSELHTDGPNVSPMLSSDGEPIHHLEVVASDSTNNRGVMGVEVHGVEAHHAPVLDSSHAQSHVNTFAPLECVALGTAEVSATEAEVRLYTVDAATQSDPVILLTTPGVAVERSDTDANKELPDVATCEVQTDPELHQRSSAPAARTRPEQADVGLITDTKIVCDASTSPDVVILTSTVPTTDENGCNPGGVAEMGVIFPSRIVACDTLEVPSRDTLEVPSNRCGGDLVCDAQQYVPGAKFIRSKGLTQFQLSSNGSYETSSVDPPLVLHGSMMRPSSALTNCRNRNVRQHDGCVQTDIDLLVPLLMNWLPSRSPPHETTTTSSHVNQSDATKQRTVLRMAHVQRLSPSRVDVETFNPPLSSVSTTTTITMASFGSPSGGILRQRFAALPSTSSMSSSAKQSAGSNRISVQKRKVAGQ